MSIESYSDFVGLKDVGRIVRLAIDEMAMLVRPGATTGEVADIGEQFRWLDRQNR